MRYPLYMINMMLALVLLSATPFTKFLINATLSSNSNSLNIRHIATQCLDIYRYNPSQADKCHDLKQKVNQFESYQRLPAYNNNHKNLSNFYREL